MKVKKRPAFIVELTPEPGTDDPIRMLRGLLKIALRRFHLKCTDVKEVPGEPQ